MTIKTGNLRALKRTEGTMEKVQNAKERKTTGQIKNKKMKKGQFKMKSSIANLTNSSAKKTNILQTVNVSADRSADKNKKLKAEYDAKMKSYKDSLASYENRVKIHNLLNPGDRMTDSELKTSTEEISRLQTENVERGIYDIPTKDVFVMSTLMGGKDPKNHSFLVNLKPTDPGYGSGRYPTPSMDDSLKPTKPEEPRYDQELVKLDMRALKNIPTSSMNPELKKALPVGIRNDRYYTAERVGLGTHTRPEGNDGLELIKLKDQAGNVVFKGSQTEYNEKYGDALSPGTKKYGQENLKRRLYPQGYTKK